MQYVHHMNRRALIKGAASLLPLLCAPIAAVAQEKIKVATLIVGSPAGGANDRVARLFADGLRGKYAETIIVENRPGAGGLIAFDYVKRRGTTDGSLFMMTPAYPLVITPHLVSNLPYDPLRDFEPVAPAGRGGMSFVVGPGVPASVQNFKEYLAWAKADPKKNNLYAAQSGTTQHLVGAVIAISTGVALENVSYRGDAPAIQDLLGGHVPAVVLPLSSALPLSRQGTVRILAVTRTTRSRHLPNVPTFVEMGYQDIVFEDWIGLFMPAGTPAARVKLLNEAVVQVSKSPKGAEGLSDIGLEPEIASVESFSNMVRSDFQHYKQFVDRTGFKSIYEKAQGASRK